MIKRKISAFLFAGLFSGSLLANPTGGIVTSGNVQITQSPGQTSIQQNSQQAIVQWKSFNIGTNEKTHFQQPQGGVALNRIDATQGPSQIYGQLTATGKIILVNQAGIFFGPGAYVNVGSIIASTSGISDQNFLAGKLIFDQPSPFNGTVINKGTLIAAQNGLVALLGNSISNEGMIQAQAGTVLLASGKTFTLDLYGDQLINFTVQEGITTASHDKNDQPLQAAVNNSGTLIADGGTILLTAKAASQVVDNVINMSGVAQARSVSQQNGQIILAGGSTGNVVVSGLLDASGTTAGQAGGTVKVLGDMLTVASTAKVTVSGSLGGGEILIGGNYQGKGPEQNARQTTVDAGARLDASALTFGNAGKVIVWSDGETRFHGSITAQGGVAGGNGGLAETSGHYLDATQATVNLLAPQGKTGTWLLDPTDLTISTASNSNVTQAGNVFTGDSNATASILNVNTLTTALSTANIIVQTAAGGTGSGSGDIIVAAPISWSASTSLTLSAYRNIALNANISNTAGSNVTVNLQADNTGTGTGTVTGSGIVTTASNGLVNIYYNPVDYTAPTNYSANVSGGTLTAYMLINALGTATDSATTKTLGALSNPSNTSLWSQNYALGRDIDATATATWNGGAGFYPIGNMSIFYSGTFDGQQHVIDKLFMNVSSNINSDIGLFGDLSGTIHHLGVTNASITSSAMQTGGQFDTGILVGQIVVGGIGITDSYTTGTISNTTGAVRIGGLVGQNAGSITRSYSSAAVSLTYSGSGSFANVGGLIGYNFGGQTSESYTQGGSVHVTLTSFISYDPIHIGGFIGANSGAISNSYSLINVTFNTNAAFDSFTGGFTGQNIAPGSITNSYSAGAVTAGPGGIVDGFGNSEYATAVTNSFWDSGTSGTSLEQLPGLTPGCFSGINCPYVSSSVSLSSQATYNNWDFTSVWGIIEGQSYPYLRTFYPTTPRAISGDASDSVPVNTTVVLSSGGNTLDSTQTFVNGAYYFLEKNNTITDDTPLLLYLTGATKANTVTVAPSSGGSLINATLTANTLQLGDSNTQSLTNTILSQALGSLGTTNALYSASSNSLTLGAGSNLTVTLQSTPTTTYTLTGLTTAGTSQLNLLGTTVIDTPSLDIGGSQTYTGTVNLAQNTLFSADNSESITFTNLSALNGNGHTLGISSGTIALSGTISGVSDLTLNGDTITLSGANVTTTGSQTYNNAVTIGANTSLTSQQLIFNDAVTLGADTTLTSNDQLIFNGAVTFGNNATLTSNNQLTFNDAITLGTNTTLTSNNQLTFNDTVTLSANTTLNSNQFIFNHDIIGNAYDLTLQGLSGDNYFIFKGTASGLNHFTLQGGAAGNNTIDFSNLSVPLSVVLSAAGTDHGLSGSTDYAAMSFNNIDAIAGSASLTNSLTGENTAAQWLLSGTNAGTYTGSHSLNFSQFQYLIGGSTGANTFHFASGASLSGGLDGGNTSQVNAVTVMDGVKLSLSAIDAGSIYQLSNNAPLTTFTRIQMATALGATGSIVLPSEKFTVTYYNAPTYTNGEIGDPFFFYNFTVPGHQPTVAPTSNPLPLNLNNVMAGANPANNDFAGNEETLNMSAASQTADNSVTSVIEDITTEDLEVEQLTSSYGCFSAQ